MEIQLNKNFEEYKGDFFKGLSAKQTAIGALAAAAGVGGFCLGTLVLGLPATAGVYLALPLCLAVALMGFGRKKGIPLPEYYKGRLGLKKNGQYVYAARSAVDEEKMDEGAPAASGEERPARNKKKEKAKGEARLAPAFLTLPGGDEE